MESVDILIKTAALISEIADMVRRGVSDEDIKERLFNPSGVGSDLINSIKKRSKDGKDYLGR
jgi:hypothetical protein